MIIPIRCFSCNKVIGNKWEPYQKLLSDGKTPKEAMDKLSITRYCCRRMILSHVDIIDRLIASSNAKINNVDIY